MEVKYRGSPLWSILVEVVKSLPLYAEHKAYVRDRVLPEKPDISAEELAALLGITLGEAMVLLSELRKSWREVEEELRRPLPKPKYSYVAAGGTFNEVHHGHLMLLLTALRVGRKVLIGVTSDEFVKRLGKKHPVKRFDERVKGLRKVLEKYGWIERCEVKKIDDPYGPTVEDPSIEALVTSPFTYFRAIEINEIRVKKGMKPLEITVSPLVVAEDGKPVSSTRIARGEISQGGRKV